MKFKFENRYKLMFFVALSYILINLLYISGVIHLGYYFIGIVEILQLLILVVLLMVEIKSVIKLRKIKFKNMIPIMILIVLVAIIGYSVIIWSFFMT